MSKINNNLPIVFLDIDGVLNSANFFSQDNIYPRNNLRSQFDPQAISYLNEIADWNFVLSSTWRKFIERDELNKLLNDMGFKGIIIDYTPDLNWQGSLRGNEIRVWMNENGLRYSTKYIIFDDDSDMLLWQKDNFIHIDGYFGLSPNHVYRAKRKMAKTLN